jgi:hypothetical protein
MRSGGKGKEGGCTVTDDPATYKEGRRDDVQDSERAELVRGVPHDEVTVRTHARFCIVDIVQSVCSLSLQDSLVVNAARSMSFNEHGV